MPLISVVTPAYNSAHSLSVAINSVRAQTFGGWEMIIVDDASDDATTALASRYALEDERIRIIRRAENGGISKARNQSMNAATGRYIAFLDADDFWLPEKLERQLVFMNEMNATLSCTGYRYFSDPDAPHKVVKTSPRVTFDKLLQYNPISISSVMIDRDTSGPFAFDEQLSRHEDFALWLFMTKSGHDIYFLDQDLVRRRCASSLSKMFYKLIGLWRAYSQAAGLKTSDTIKAIMIYGLHATWRRVF